MNLLDRIDAVQNRIARACQSAGRHSEEITLIAVSKTINLEGIQEAYKAGIRNFGESRWQEASPKIAQLPSDIRWHFIGRLQSNKARVVAQNIDVIHTIEKESHCQEIAKAGRTIDGLIEVNLAGEAQKGGILASELDEFYRLVLHYSQVNIRGFMTIGPWVADAEDSRVIFRNLYRLASRFDGSWLSMGMSNDFDVAIQEGATHIRVGTAIFGER
jgi:hypothetical protein